MLECSLSITVLVQHSSQNGMTGYDSRFVGYAANRKTTSAEPQAKEPVDEKNKICWFGCPCRDDYCGGCRSGWRGEITRAPSPRQLSTDHDYAVSTREYQSGQPSQW